MHKLTAVLVLCAAAPAAAFAPGQALLPRAALRSPRVLRSPRAPRRAAGAQIFAQIDQLQTAGPVSRPEVGKVSCPMQRPPPRAAAAPRG